MRRHGIGVEGRNNFRVCKEKMKRVSLLGKRAALTGSTFIDNMVAIPTGSKAVDRIRVPLDDFSESTICDFLDLVVPSRSSIVALVGGFHDIAEAYSLARFLDSQRLIKVTTPLVHQSLGAAQLMQMAATYGDDAGLIAASFKALRKEVDKAMTDNHSTGWYDDGTIVYSNAAKQPISDFKALLEKLPENHSSCAGIRMYAASALDTGYAARSYLGWHWITVKGEVDKYITSVRAT